MEVREPSAKYLARPAYKQSEVGLIPEDWNLAFIEEHAVITTGGRNTQDRVDDGLYPFFVRSQTVERINSYSFDGEAVLTAGDGVGTGKVFHYINGKFDAHQRVYRISDFSEHLNGYFFHLYFSTHFFSRIMQMTAKSSVDSVRREMIARMQIPLPPTISEQQAIAEALSDADALIESLEQLLAKKHQIKQGAMQELLTGQKRLPGFAGDWQMNRLGDSATLKARIGWQGLTTAEYKETGDFYLVTGTEFENGYIDWSDCFFVDESRYRQDRNIQLRLLDVLVTKDGTIGKVALIDQLPLPSTLNSGVFVIRPIDGAFHPKFFYYLLCSEQFTSFLDQLSAGSTINHLYQKDFVGFVFKAPASIKEQTAIATLLSDMDAELAALEAKLAKARDLKQGMMQELLTGQKRLPGFAGAWKSLTLGEVAPLQRGFDLPNGRLLQGPSPVVYSNGVLYHHNEFQVKGPGVVTGRSGTIGAVTFVEEDYWPHNTALWVTSFKGNGPKFVFYLYTSIGLERFATGSGVPTLNRNDVHVSKVNIPPSKEEQTAIATILSDMDAELAALEAKLAKARDLKQGMMQELLTGRIRLV